MLARNVLSRLASRHNLLNLVTVRTIVRHPTPGPVEFIHGRSKVGEPAAFEPMRVELEKGKSYSWCSCGKSAKQPWCDGSHKKLNAELKDPEADKCMPLRFTCEESRSVLICACKSSSNRPFCDGTHENVKKLHAKKFDILL